MIDTKPIKLSGGASNATVLAYTQKWHGGEGMRRHGVVICYLPGNYDEFVTWTAYYVPEDEEWFAETGHYFNNIIDAANDYEKRGGR